MVENEQQNLNGGKYNGKLHSGGEVIQEQIYFKPDLKLGSFIRKYSELQDLSMKKTK